jgi:electron transfer flavoprotein alpha/beta subunit
MRIAACVKQIADPIDRYQPDDNTIRLRRHRKLVLDGSHIYGVETALQLVDLSGEGGIILISTAPNGETNCLRTTLAMAK